MTAIYDSNDDEVQEALHSLRGMLAAVAHRVPLVLEPADRIIGDVLDRMTTRPPGSDDGTPTLPNC